VASLVATFVEELVGVEEEVVGVDEEVPPDEEVVSTDAEDPVDWLELPPQPERTKTEPKTSASNVRFSMCAFLRNNVR
jgi:hypothetical protein